jgi:hypothetical protein
MATDAPISVVRRDRATSPDLPDGSIEPLEVPTVPEPQTPPVVLAKKITGW